MGIANGTKIGPYEITGTLGAGGMGEVYRARDSRLERDVAIKILPASLAQDADRLKRFEQEARAVGALNHPNILAIYDIGQHEDCPYLVSELLDGEDLRKHMDGSALPQRAAVEYAAQIAHGLAAAHEKGVVHRDLKPDNIFVLRDGRIKILDFGLAKLVRPETGSALNSGPTLGISAAPATSPGQVMGTVGYMSPEQVRGLNADHRTDIFSFGAILYEILTGRRAFKRDSSIETMTAILKEEPEEITQTTRNINPGLERIVRHCLEKAPERRFQSARDLAFDLESLTQGTGTTTRTLVSVRAQSHRWKWLALASLALAVAVVLFYAGRKTAGKVAGEYHQLTFQRGWINRARFSPGGETITFSADWNGQGLKLFTGRAKSLNWQPSFAEPMDIAAISKNGDMLVLRRIRQIFGFATESMLATVPVNGGSPKDLIDGVESADYAPDGQNIAIAHYLNGRYQIEAPIGKILYTAPTGWLSDVRYSPDGKTVAFFEHPALGDARGYVRMVTLEGKKTDFPNEYSNLHGSAWHPNGEFWFTGSETGLHQAMFALDKSGGLRVIERVPGNLSLFDISANGQVLLSHDILRRTLMAYSKSLKHDIDLSWFDWTNLRGMTEDGQYVLLEEEGEGGGPDYTLFMRNVNGDPPTRIANGYGFAFSPDGKWIATGPVNDSNHLSLLPTGIGEAKALPGNMEHLRGSFSRDGQHIIFTARLANGNVQIFEQDVKGGEPRPIAPEGLAGFRFSPDEKKLLVLDSQTNVILLYDLASGQKEPVKLRPEDSPLHFAPNGDLFVAYTDPAHLEVTELDRVDLHTGKRQTLFTIRTDPAGLITVGPIFIAGDGSTYAYSMMRIYSDLYTVDGLK